MQPSLFDAPETSAPARTYGSLSLQASHWVLADLQPHVAIRLKQLFPKVPKSSPGPFRLPNDLPTAADLEWFTSRYPLRILPADHERMTGCSIIFRDRMAEVERLFLPDYRPPEFVGLRDGAQVRTYQGQAVDMLERVLGLLLVDDLGLGKTFVGAFACLRPDMLPAVVVCQPHLQKQWAKVIRATTTLRVHVIKGTKPYDLPEADVYLFRYTQLAGWVDTFAELAPRLVIWDEIQELRTGRGTAKGAAAKALADVATYRLGLTATPIYGYSAEIWHVLQFVNDTVLGDFEDFAREWCTPLSNGKYRINDPKALGSYLRDQNCMLRWTKADVGKEMPAVNRIVHEVEYDAKAVSKVEEMARKLAIKATTGSFVERGQAARDLDIMVRQATGVAKAVGAADFARMVVEGGAPVVLVGWHREVYDIWARQLADLKPAFYTGTETTSQKDKAVQAFLSGETDLLILSLRSGAGLDGLQARGSTIIFGELDWSHGVHHQCVGRLDREGQTEPVTAIFLVTDQGSDPPMMELLGLKASEASAIVDPTLGVQQGRSDASHLQTLVQRYLGKQRALAA